MSRIIRNAREESAARLRGQIVPAIATVIGSATVLLPLIATAPVMPPFGLLVLLAWRLLRPELWPVWIGLPLGLVDDVFSGQPIGSAPLLWTLVILAIDQIDQRLLFRDYWQDWLIAAAATVFALVGGLLLAHRGDGPPELSPIMPQILVSALLFPLVAYLCARLDRWRLA